jgi:hypothetical protein
MPKVWEFERANSVKTKMPLLQTAGALNLCIVMDIVEAGYMS